MAERIWADVQSVKDINAHLLNELERFFISYNETRGKTFRFLGVRGPKQAMKLVQSASQAQKKSHR